MGEATLRPARRRSGCARGFAALAHTNEAWNIGIDGAAVGKIANVETVGVSVEPGPHTMRLGQGRHISPQRSLDVPGDEVVSFHCDVHHPWPLLLAVQVKNDVWITLRQS